MAIIEGTTGNNKLTGTSGADSIDGLAGHDTLLGLAGVDTLLGGDGNDSLNGGADADEMAGGAGDDIYVVDNIEDTVTELDGEGTDTVQASIDFQLPDYVENLVITSSNAASGLGNDLNNTITSHSGTHSLIGGDGDDVYIVQNATNMVFEEEDEGDDTVRSAVSYTLLDNVENLVLLERSKKQIQKVKTINGTGSADNNSLTGNKENNTLDGSGGDDTLIGGTGNDTYLVDSEDDVIEEDANKGTDTVKSTVSYALSPNVENLILLGETNIDGTGNTLKNAITGNDGDNELDGGTGADTMKGLDGDDIYHVDDSKDVVTEAAGKGTDTVISTLANYILSANVENLELSAEGGNLNGAGNDAANTIEGNDGNNRLDGGKGNDTLIGYEGDDTYVIDSVGDVITEQDGDGTDTVQSTLSYTLGDFLEKLMFLGKNNLSGTGNDENNILNGNIGNNSLNGLEGNDTLIGGDGNDTLDGGEGDDSMTGGDGNDTYFVDDAGDIVTEVSSKEGGTDTVRASVSYTLGNNLEKLILEGEATSGTGNSLANTITGNEEENRLDGGTGNDTLIGGAGIDTYAFSGNFGQDTISDTNTNGVLDLSGVTANGTVTLAVDTKKAEATYGKNTINWNSNLIETVKTSAIIDVIGGSGNDKITGDARDNDLSGGNGNDTLSGGNGDDSLTGGDGNDSLVGGEGNDTLTGGNGVDTLVGGAGSDTYYIDSSDAAIVEAVESGHDTVHANFTYTLTNNVENLTLTGSGNFSGTGNDEDNEITGNTGNNVLSGGSGDDTLRGGEGIDTLLGGDDDDQLYGDEGADSMVGGEGDDIYIVDDANDVASENLEGGEDIVFASVSYTLGNNIETLQLTGTDNINGTGSSSSEFILGNEGNNILNGGAGGDDTLAGGDGNDTYVFTNSSGTAYISEENGQGNDTLDLSARTDSLTIDLDAGIVSGLTIGYDEFQVNTTTVRYPQPTTMATFNDGSIIVVWNNYSNNMYAQRYTATGSKLGSEVQIAGENAVLPDVTVLENGDYVVAWHIADVNTGYDDIFARRYTQDGTPVTDAFKVNTYTTYQQQFPTITALFGEAFVITWTSLDQDGDSYGVYGQLYSGENAPVGGEFRVSTTTSGSQNWNDITALSGGGFVVTWVDDPNNAPPDIKAQIYNSSAQTVGSPFTVNTYTTSQQLYPTISALSDGGFVIVWTSEDQEGDETFGLFGQRFSSSGIKDGEEFHINTSTAGDQQEAVVAGLSNGGFVVVWYDTNGADGDSYGVFGRVYDDEGDPVGAEFRVNTTTEGMQLNPSVTELSNGSFMVTWTSGNIFGQVFDAQGNPVSSATLVTFDSEANEIENAYGGDGSDTIVGNALNNLLAGGDGGDTITGGAGDDTLQGGEGEDTYVFSGNFGDDIVDDTEDGGTLDFNAFDLNDDVASWQAFDGDDVDSFVDALLITFNNGSSVTVQNYFSNTSADDDASSAGTGYLDIEFVDDLDVDFAQVQALIS